NNGGYFLIFDVDLPDIGTDEKTIIVSFEVEISERGIPKYFNCFKLINPEIFEGGLEDRKHYIFIDHIKVDGKDVKEYHPTIPAHTFAFQVFRDRNKNLSENTTQYLPIEFNLKESNGGIILNREKVLPIMPTSPDEDDNHL